MGARTPGHASIAIATTTGSRFSALLLVALLACGAADDGVQLRPDVVLVTFDTARADRFGAYGYTKGHTPNFDRLAAEGVLFELAMAPAPLTLPSHASILTGVYPTAHGIHDNGRSSLGPMATLLSEVFQNHGWRTGAFVGSYVLDAHFGLDQGFEVYRGPGEKQARPRAERAAIGVVSDAKEWVSALDGDAPIFLWVHFYDPHFPYDAKWKRFEEVEDPYDREIAFCDVQLGRLLRAFRKRTPARPMITVVTADHGEALGEHRERTHGLLVHQSTLRVPLVIAGAPVDAARGTRVPHAVSIAALAPTLLRLAELPAGEMPAAVFAPLLEPGGSPPAKRDESIYFENEFPYGAHRWRAGRGLVWDKWKLIEGRPSQLYALSEDPSELRDVASENPKLVQELEARLERLVRAHPPLDWRERREVGDEERRLLESLGYAETREGDDPYDLTLPDIRDRLDDVEALRETRILLDFAQDLGNDTVATALQGGDRDRRVKELLDKAADLIEPVRERNPGSPSVARRLSRLEGLRGNHERAAKLLEEIVNWGAGSKEDRFQLALLREKVGQPPLSFEVMESLTVQYPEYPEPYEWLASRHRSAGELDIAVVWAERLVAVLEVDSQRRVRAQRFLAETNEERRKRAGNGAALSHE